MNMKRGYWLVSALVAALFCPSCVAKNSMIRYHHGNPAGSAFWMTVSSTAGGYDRSVETSLWYCSAESKGEPLCTQAKLRTCDPKTADCVVLSDMVSLDEMASSRSAGGVSHDDTPATAPGLPPGTTPTPVPTAR